MDHEKYMRAALQEAKMAYEKDEVPIGAVIVAGDRIIARAHNLTETLNDVTAHAEMQAFTAAADFLGGKYLNECTLYVTIEPCPMCAGAAFWAQLGAVVFGAKDEKRGYSIINTEMLHPKTKTISGILESECSELIRSFFLEKRSIKN